MEERKLRKRELRQEIPAKKNKKLKRIKKAEKEKEDKKNCSPNSKN